MRIDPWTIALQTINVLVLVWLLAHFLFRPVAEIIAARRKAADAVLAEADAARAKVAADAAALAQQRESLAGDGERIVAAARATAEAERQSILRLANEAATKLHAEAQQANDRDRQAMRDALQSEAADLATTIAARLLERVPARALGQAFLEGLAEALTAGSAGASLAGVPIEMRSAVPLDPAAQADCAEMLARFLGTAPQLSFRVDPTLIAGVELATPQVVIRNSWRADLDRITRALHEDADHDLASQPVA